MVMSVQEIIRSIEQLPLSEREFVVRSIVKTIQDNEHVQSVASIKRQHPDEWLAIIIPDGEDAYDPKRGRLIAHEPRPIRSVGAGECTASHGRRLCFLQRSDSSQRVWNSFL